MRSSSLFVCALLLAVPAACGGSSFEDGASPAQSGGSGGVSSAGSAGKASGGASGAGAPAAGAAGSTAGGSSGAPTAGAAGSPAGGAAGSPAGGAAGSPAGGAAGSPAGGAAGSPAGGAAGSPAGGAAGAGGFGPGYCDPLAPFDTIEALPAPINDPNPNNAVGDFTAWMSPSQSFIAWARWDNSDIFATSKSAVTQQWGPEDDLKGSGSAGFDFFPSLLPDLKKMYFTSDREGPAAYRQYVTTRPSIGDNFSNVQLVEIPGRKATDREFGGQITNDGTALYFASTRASANNAVWNPKQLDLYVLQDVGTAGASVHALATVNLPNVEDSYPAISPDQRVLYFGSTRAGMGYDIYVAARADLQSPFSSPVLAPGLQTPNGDHPNWISGDYCTLLFHRTTGNKSVIYIATRTAL